MILEEETVEQPLINIAPEEKKLPYWVYYIRRRIEKNKNFLGFIGGVSGSGKSWAGLSICLMVDPTFHQGRIVTNMRQLLRLINSGELKSGNAILWDEAGIDINNKSWQSLTNKAINFLVQTFRHKRFILIFTSPFIDFIDNSTRKMFHAEFLMRSINEKESRSKLKPYIIQYNGRKRKFYYKYLRVKSPNGMIVPLKTWNIPKPPIWLIESYEDIKTKFTSNLNKDLERQLNEQENLKDPNYRKPLTPLQEKSITLMAKYKNVKKVAEEMGIIDKTVYFHIAMAHRKGYENSEFAIENIAKKGGGTENTDFNAI